MSDRGDEGRTIDELVSRCHHARVRTNEPVPDFFDGRIERVATMYFVCTECGQPCDVEPAS